MIETKTLGALFIIVSVMTLLWKIQLQNSCKTQDGAMAPNTFIKDKEKENFTGKPISQDEYFKKEQQHNLTHLHNFYGAMAPDVFKDEEKENLTGKPISQDDYIKNEQQRRLNHLHDFCRQQPFTQKIATLSNILVDDKHKVLYCAIPKAGCSAWKWNLVTMNTNITFPRITGRVHYPKFLEDHGIRTLNTYEKSEIVERIEQYYKFIFVRHPMSRLLSGFKNKFVKSPETPFIIQAGPYIVKHANRPVDPRGPAYYNITFTEFLSYIFYSKDYRLRHDPHFENTTPLCSPCAIKYDFIGKQETFDQDAQYLFKNIFHRNISTPETPMSTHSGRQETSRAFRKVPKYLHKLAKKQFIIDAKMFGYDIHGFT